MKIHGIIRRRLLVNFRVEPAVIQRLLPARFRPKVHAGHAVAGICLIRRRLLVNFRVEPAVIQRLLPPRVRPKLHDGQAVAGICLIRLEHIRPKRFPSVVGVSSENPYSRWCSDLNRLLNPSRFNPSASSDVSTGIS